MGGGGGGGVGEGWLAVSSTLVSHERSRGPEDENGCVTRHRGPFLQNVCPYKSVILVLSILFTDLYKIQNKLCSKFTVIIQ